MDDLERDATFVYKDQDDIAKTIRDHIDDDDLLNQMGAKSRAYVEPAYKWQSNLRILDDVIQKIVDSSGINYNDNSPDLIRLAHILSRVYPYAGTEKKVIQLLHELDQKKLNHF